MSVLDEIIFVIGAGGAIFFGFGVLGLVADFVCPHLKWLNDWINTLPMMRGEKF